MCGLVSGAQRIQPEAHLCARSLCVLTQMQSSLQEAKLKPLNRTEAYGEDYKPPTLSHLLDAVGGDLTAFGFLE